MILRSCMTLIRWPTILIRMPRSETKRQESEQDKVKRNERHARDRSQQGTQFQVCKEKRGVAMKKVWGLVLTVSLIWFGIGFAQDGPPAPDAQKLQQLLRDFEAYARKGMEEWRIPGMAIAIVQKDSVIFAKGFGVKGNGGSAPVTPHTIFQIGSTTKAFTAALIAMLVDEGKIKWKDRVTDYVPDFRMYDPWVTREFMIEDLLAQHSGLPPYSGDAQAFFGFDRRHIQKSLTFIKPVSSFRSEFAYVNHLFLVAAQVVENLTGKSWEDNVRERIFVPLKMSESSYDRNALMEGRDVATGHNVQGNTVIAVPKDLNWPYIYGPAGGINSNVMDMSQWLRLHIHDGTVDGVRLVSEENMNFMHSPKTIAAYDAKKELGAYYCQSWIYVDSRPYPFVWHNGGTTGYHSMIAFWPEPKIGMVILTNESSNKLAEALPKYFADLYFGNPNKDYSQAALDKAKKAKAEADEKAAKQPETVSPALPLNTYVGIYSNPVYEDARVTLKNGAMTLLIGPGNVKLPLRHWNRDIFVYSVPLLGEDSEGFVRFGQNFGGSIQEMTMDMLNEDGCGVFKRLDGPSSQ
jgi:CubicO group peptidase (beta-lactamase class C family)